MTASPSAAPAAPLREAYDRDIEAHGLVALWTRLQALAPPHRWAYAQVRPWLLASASLISAEEAERRVLVLENPALPGSSRITPMLYAGLQLIMPGECAPTHRHSISALRFMVEGHGAHTCVDGERIPMHEGDFIVTPAGSWHDHGHEGSSPVVWLDGLDLGIVSSFNAVFFERAEATDPVGPQTAGLSMARYGSGLLPLDSDTRAIDTPVCCYPYARTLEALSRLARTQAPDPHFGHLLRYANPLNGGWAMATMATTMRLLPAGFRSQPYRSTEGLVLSIFEGRGRVRIGAEMLDFGPKDTLVLPGWQHYALEAETEAVIFSYSDRAAQEKLGLFREQRG